MPDGLFIWDTCRSLIQGPEVKLPFQEFAYFTKAFAFVI